MEIESLRSYFESKLKDGIPNPPGEFDEQDLERLKNDEYLNRILLHHDNDPKLGADMLWDILTWRKVNNVNRINENTIKMDYLREGAFFPHGRDVDGNLLLIIKCKMHVKGQKDFEDLRKVLIYWFERIERQENGKPITLFFDMDGCGLGNMDMELIKYLITLMKLYYPYFLHYIIIYQMPWVLSAAFKVVKSLLPAKAIERMKFLNKDNLKNVVPPEQALLCWDGLDPYVFEFIPETKSEHTPKKVTFAEQGDNQHSPGEMLRLVPNDTIIFKMEKDEISAQFTVTNMDESPVSFKIRTTSPEKFRVRPSSGTLGIGSSQTVSIVVQPGFQIRSVFKDRFLVMSVHIPKTEMSQNEISEIWKSSTGSKIDEYRLKCQTNERDISINGSVADGRNQEKSDSNLNALNNLQINYEMLHKQVKMLRLYQFLSLFMSSVAVLLGFLIYKKANISDMYCDHI